VALRPGDRRVIAARLETIPDAKTPDRPIIDLIDRSELWEIDGAKLRRRFKSIELKDRGRVGAGIGYVREVREWLDHVEKSIETKRPALHILPRLGELERGFHSGVKDRAEYVATILDWLSECRIGQEKIRHQRV